MPIILALDPGPKVTGWVIVDAGRVVGAGTKANADALALVGEAAASGVDLLAVEKFEARGMPMGQESIDTMIWVGRFQQAWRNPEAVRLVYRRTVKLALCGTARAKDPNVRQALIDMLGPSGTKRSPGPTYGVTSHAWAALGVAVVAVEGAA